LKKHLRAAAQATFLQNAAANALVPELRCHQMLSFFER
jgi:hypothetical protein